jgi:hypothetical protein
LAEETKVRTIKTTLAATTVVLVATMGNASATTRAPNSASQVLAQAENPSPMSRVKQWTRATLEAAKKHWAQDQAKFYECSHKLDEMKKSRRRMSYHRQGHFLENCMKE